MQRVWPGVSHIWDLHCMHLSCNSRQTSPNQAKRLVPPLYIVVTTPQPKLRKGGTKRRSQGCRWLATWPALATSLQQATPTVGERCSQHLRATVHADHKQGLDGVTILQLQRSVQTHGEYAHLVDTATTEGLRSTLPSAGFG